MEKRKIKLLENEIGKKYNYLTVVGESEPELIKNSKGEYLSRRWLFRCECGNEKIINPSNVFNGSTKSCGCKKHELMLAATQKYYTEHYKTPVEDKMYSSYERECGRRKKREFKLSKEEFNAIVNSNCHYCGRPPFTIKSNKTKSVIKALNGIDRVDNSKGYILSNVVPCCKHCNIAKANRNLDEFLNWVKLLYENVYKK